MKLSLSIDIKSYLTYFPHRLNLIHIMNRKLPFTILLVVITFLQSCVTAKITSNKDADYIKQPKKIFILMNVSKEASGFSNGLLWGLKSKLKEKGVESTSYQHNPLSFDTDQDINKKIDDYAPEALMVIKQKVVHSINSMVDGSNFEITLIDNETKKTVWKSDFEVYGQMGIEDAVNKGVNELLKKLMKDKII
jgi:hypothetical protein